MPPVTQTTSRWPPRALGLQLHLLFERDLDLIATRLRELRAGALVFGTGGFIANHRQQLLALARDQALPTMGFNRAFAVDGGLMSYGSDGREAPHTVGLYAGRILKMLWDGSGEHISIAALSDAMEPVMTKPKTKNVNDFSRCLDPLDMDATLIPALRISATDDLQI